MYQVILKPPEHVLPYNINFIKTLGTGQICTSLKGINVEYLSKSKKK